MADVLIVGDGPGGLSAALLLAKNGMDVVVFGQNETPMHRALLYNYLGIEKITGSEFQETARRQVTRFGATIRDEAVTDVERAGGDFAVMADGRRHQGRYLVIAEGHDLDVADKLGLETNDLGVAVDRSGRTSLEGAYAVGWATRGRKIQAVISAGDGAAAALDILSAEADRDVHDFDVVS